MKADSRSAVVKEPAEERSLVPAVTRAAAILELLAGEPDAVGVSALARRLGLPKSSVANLCATLVDTGLLRAQDGGFRLGQRLAQLGAAYLAGVDQVRLFHECCGRLVAGRNETAQLAMLGDALDVVYLARRDGVYPVRLASAPGRALPASCTATGKAMLATLQRAEVQARLARAGPLPRLTAASITSRAKLDAELETIRRQGFAVDREEVIEGVVCVAAAIPRRGPSGEALAVSVTLLKPRATAELIAQLAGELRDLTAAHPRTLGRRGPAVTRLGLGCAPLGNLFTAVSDADAEATVEAAWDLGIRFFDTAPLYGHGLSERRLGRALRRWPRDAYTLATKVGRLLRPPSGAASSTIFAEVPALEPVFDFSRDGVLRSFEESLERLGADRLDVVHVHDPDDHEQDALAGAFPTLVQLREEGVVRAVGCGMNQVAMLERFVERVDLDCVLLAGRHTLLDQHGAERLLARCQERDLGVVLGGVFNSGLLVDPDTRPVYDYEPAPPGLVERTRQLRAVCERYGTRLPAAALQFALRHPAVSSVVVGARTATEIHADVLDAQVPIAETVWAELAIGPNAG